MALMLSENQLVSMTLASTVTKSALLHPSTQHLQTAPWTILRAIFQA